jgi:Mrp family chromosome partitioning ATPase
VRKGLQAFSRNARPFSVAFVVRLRVTWQHATMGKRPMHTIALISRKGGTGKSTLAIGLAVAATEAGHKVCLLEADPLGTVSNWRRRRTSAEPTLETRDRP